MVSCWAVGIGGCSAKQTAEHYVTRGLWSVSEIMISGFDWQGGKAKSLPVATLETHILCKTHNGALSEVDAEAIRIFRFIGEALTTIQSWQKEAPAKKPLFPSRYYADGELFERWCAKTLIDFLCVEKSETVWHDTGTPMMQPPVDVVRAVFGMSNFHHPMGLYLAQESTDRPQDVLREALTVDPRFHPGSGGLMGGFIGFRDYRFLIWLSKEPFELFTTETRGGVVFGGDSGNRVFYHPDTLKVQLNYVVRHKVILKW